MTEELTLEDYDKLYIVSRLVYQGEIALDKAASKLADMIPTTAEQNKITISMYAGMRNGRSFHHSLSDDVVIYFLKRIADEEGVEALERALNATYGYAGFKNSVGSPLPELEEACDAFKVKYGLNSKSGHQE